MEIYSLRSYYNSTFRNGTSKNTKTPGIEIETANPVFNAAQTSEQNASNLDFSSMTPRDLREVARVGLEDGLIDQETFATISEGLPMQTIDVNGRIVDLSDIGDNTPFNFRDYYESQLDIAMSIGSGSSAEVLRSIMSFIGNGR
ncbi:MAG: hypothetical protein BGN83_03700 [Rhizobium sp. 63-7]|nr:MAG: hypothetical protein BGN83_03700 [Rhizobium sp. 63-7]